MAGAIYARLNSLSSALSTNASNYALFGHTHRYSDFNFFPSYGPQSHNNFEVDANGNVKDYTNVASCFYAGKFKVIDYKPGENVSSLSEISVYYPKDAYLTKIQDTTSYKVGDIQMIALGTKTFKDYLTDICNYKLTSYSGKQNISVDDPQFDGWIIPNGATLMCDRNDFKEACTKYSATHDENATSFTVPDIQGFFRCNPGKQTTNAMQHVNGQTGLKSHNHGGSISFNFDESNKLTCHFDPIYQYTSSCIGKENQYVEQFVHGGKSGLATLSRPTVKIKSIELNLNVDSMTMADAKTDGESYPPYNDVPILLYIGKKAS